MTGLTTCAAAGGFTGAGVGAGAGAGTGVVGVVEGSVAGVVARLGVVDTESTLALAAAALVVLMERLLEPSELQLLPSSVAIDTATRSAMLGADLMDMVLRTLSFEKGSPCTGSSVTAHRWLCLKDTSCSCKRFVELLMK
jgi:hypothetical protein